MQHLSRQIPAWTGEQLEDSKSSLSSDIMKELFGAKLRTGDSISLVDAGTCQMVDSRRG